VIFAIFLLHHYVIHGLNGSSNLLEMPDRLFQIKDITNHETWIVVSIVIIVYSMAMKHLIN
jgi:hypothetical protein